MRFIPESIEKELPKVVVTTEPGHTFSKTIYPDPDRQDSVDTEYDEDSE